MNSLRILTLLFLCLGARPCEIRRTQITSSSLLASHPPREHPSTDASTCAYTRRDATDDASQYIKDEEMVSSYPLQLHSISSDSLALLLPAFTQTVSASVTASFESQVPEGSKPTTGLSSSSSNPSLSSISSSSSTPASLTPWRIKVTEGMLAGAVIWCAASLFIFAIVARLYIVQRRNRPAAAQAIELTTMSASQGAENSIASGQTEDTD